MRLSNPSAIKISAGIGIAGALAGTLAGCSSASTADNTGANSESANTSAPSASPSSAPASTTSYKDGTYTEDGTYESPAGEGRITVTLTLANSVVTAVKIDGHATDPTAKSYQSAFDNGVAGKIVGKRIDQLNVTIVSGSSLTSGGFDEAVKKIEADAA